MYPVTLVVEGDTDVPFAEKVLRAAGLQLGTVIDTGGKARLDRQLAAYNAAARGSAWFVLRDLDQDAACAASLRDILLPERSRLMCFRIPVHAVEAWALGDYEKMASFLRVRVGQLPNEPELELDPKLSLVKIARKSTRSAIRDDMVPAPGRCRKIGPGYEARLIEFGAEHWRWQVAQKHCPSLKRCIAALRRLKKELEGLP